MAQNAKVKVALKFNLTIYLIFYIQLTGRLITANIIIYLFTRAVHAALFNNQLTSLVNSVYLFLMMEAVKKCHRRVPILVLILFNSQKRYTLLRFLNYLASNIKYTLKLQLYHLIL